MGALSDPKVGELVGEHYVATYEKVGNFTAVKVTEEMLKQRHIARLLELQKSQQRDIVKSGGNVVTYFCTPEGDVLNFVVGAASVRQMREELQWARDVHLAIRTGSKKGEDREGIYNRYVRWHGEVRYLRYRRAQRLNRVGLQPLAVVEQQVFEEQAGQRGLFGRRGDRNDQLLAEVKANMASGKPTILLHRYKNGAAINSRWSRHGFQTLTVSPSEMLQLLDDLDMAPPAVGNMAYQVAIIDADGIQYRALASWARDLETDASNSVRDLSAIVQKLNAESAANE